MIIMCLDLKYEVYAVGTTKEECKANLLRGFEQYLKSYHITFEEWVENSGEDLVDYNNDMWTFLDGYYGIRTYDVTKGYALGWE